jgi:capsular exopolysaccharide synthesis family protein
MIRATINPQILRTRLSFYCLPHSIRTLPFDAKDSVRRSRSFAAVVLLLVCWVCVTIGVLALLKSDRIVTLWEARRLFPGYPIVALPTAEAQSRPSASASSADFGQKYDAAVRSLRNRIQIAGTRESICSILITSARAGEGKSRTALQLAKAYSEQQRRTLLIEADLRRPVLHRRTDVRPKMGLASVLLSDVPWQEAVLTIPGLSFAYLLPAGTSSQKAAESLGTRFGAILNAVHLEYDVVIIDSPPLLAVSESLQLASFCDTTVFVVRAKSTPRQRVAEALMTLDSAGAHVSAIAFNGGGGEVIDSTEHYSSYYVLQ